MGLPRWLAALAIVAGVHLIVFNPVGTEGWRPHGHRPAFRPLVRALEAVPPGLRLLGYWPTENERYYRRTWQPGLGLVVGGLVVLATRRRRRLPIDWPAGVAVYSPSGMP